MADRITPETSGIRRVRNVAEQRWKQRTESADPRKDGSKRRSPSRRRPRPGRDGGVDEFA